MGRDFGNKGTKFEPNLFFFSQEKKKKNTLSSQQPKDNLAAHLFNYPVDSTLTATGARRRTGSALDSMQLLNVDAMRPTYKPIGE